ncbi:hypothetical protein [Hyphomicrobium sp.]|uniref:hypothetical protein n=1 Tax=Hyphomicrobium sp. TaxID=82 RepID=UPI0025C59FF3|nr:hypothetical protein [Hyphomicrobium sp.]MCC7252434.1 hypothetical protein [Hyphomicrobium sp.]
MSIEDPEARDPRTRPTRTDTGHERRSMFRLAAVGAITLFVFLIGYFLAFGPLDPTEEPAYPPAGRNLDLENKAAPPPQPETP